MVTGPSTFASIEKLGSWMKASGADYLKLASGSTGLKGGDGIFLMAGYG